MSTNFRLGLHLNIQAPLGLVRKFEASLYTVQVEVSIVARKPSSSGRQGEGTPYFKTKTPLTWALGSDKTSTLFEEGIGSMGKGEKAFIVCPRETKYPENSLIPPPPREISRIEYEVELHSMFQVGRLL